MNTKFNVSEVTSKLIKVRVRISAWLGNVRSDEGAAELADNHDAESDAVTVGMSLLPKVVQKDIRDHVIGIRQAVRKASVPFEDGGYRVLQSKNYPALSREVETRRQAFREYIFNEVVSKYDELKEHAKLRLGTLYTDSDFPAKDKIMDKFDAKFLLDIIKDLTDFRIEGLSEVEMTKIKNDTASEMATNLVKGQMEIVQQLKKAVQSILDKTETEGSRFKRALENLGELCDMVPGLNILESKELNELAASVKAKIAKKDSDSLKDNKKVIAAVKKDGADFLDKLDKIQF